MKYPVILFHKYFEIADAEIFPPGTSQGCGYGARETQFGGRFSLKAAMPS